MKLQVALFDEAESLVLVRYDREGKTSGAPEEFDYMNGRLLVYLKPVRWVKGDGQSVELQVGMGDAPPCARMKAHDALYGKPGDVFLVYLSGGAQPALLEAYALDHIIEPRTIAALTKMPE